MIIGLTGNIGSGKSKAADYLAATAGLNVVKAVYMEVDVASDQKVAEADYIIDLCQRDEPCTAGCSGHGTSPDTGTDQRCGCAESRDGADRRPDGAADGAGIKGWRRRRWRARGRHHQA